MYALQARLHAGPRGYVTGIVAAGAAMPEIVTAAMLVIATKSCRGRT